MKVYYIFISFNKNNYLFIDKQMRVSGRLTWAMNTLPILDLARTWTDAELYSHFNLTQEEIEYIETNVK